MEWLRISLYLTATCLLCAGEGQWDIELSPQSVASVPFGSGHISIWEHANARGRYFATPQVCLLADETEVIENVFTGKTELNLRVLMWSEEAREAVQRYMVHHVNASVQQVDVLPMEKIRLIWVDPIRPLPDYYQLGDHWQYNTHLPTVVNFRVVCADADRCRALQEGIQRDHRMMNGLELQYEINAQRAARRQLKVTGSHLIRGNLFTSLSNMPGTNSSVRYLRSQDVKRLTAETVKNVMSSQITDADYVKQEDEISLSALLERVFTEDQVSTEDFRPNMWNSVFWDSDNARPDKVTSYLNKVVRVDARNSSNFLLDQNQRSTQAEVSMGIPSWFEARGSGSSRSASTLKKEDLLSTLRQSSSDVQWTGQNFTVKPMVMSRLNLASLNTSHNLASMNVQVRRYESVQGIKLRTSCGQQNQTSVLTPDLVQARLTDRIDDITNKAVAAINARGEDLGETIQNIASAITSASRGFTSASRGFTSAVSGVSSTISSVNSDWKRAISSSVGNIGPQFCKVPGYHCSTYHDYSSTSSTSLSTCRERCRTQSRCKAFSWYTYNHCRLKIAPCPHDKLSRHTGETYYVKMSASNSLLESLLTCQFIQSKI